MSDIDDTDGGCATCQRNSRQLAALTTSWWECSHVDCPQRRRVTAAPPDDGTESMGADGSGCWRLKPVYLE